MTGSSKEQELRSILLAFSGFAYIGAMAELYFIGHYEGFIQLIPFVLSIIGLIIVAAAWRGGGKTTLQALRYISWIIGLGGIFGIYEHLHHNYGFEIEIHPEYTFGTAIWEATGGALPFLAPGILCFAALLAIAATWRHPALSE